MLNVLALPQLFKKVSKKFYCLYNIAFFLSVRSTFAGSCVGSGTLTLRGDQSAFGAQALRFVCLQQQQQGPCPIPLPETQTSLCGQRQTQSLSNALSWCAKKNYKPIK